MPRRAVGKKNLQPGGDGEVISTEMTTDGKDETGGMDPRDDEALWNLLGRHEPPAKASPYFARRVLREIALDEQRGGGWFARLRRVWTLLPRHTAVWSGTLAFGMLCLSAVLTIPASRPPVAVRPAEVAAADAYVAAEVLPAPSEPAPLGEVAPVQDAEVIADLDNVLNREESRLWTEDTDTARF